MFKVFVFRNKMVLGIGLMLLFIYWKLKAFKRDAT